MKLLQFLKKQINFNRIYFYIIIFIIIASLAAGYISANNIVKSTISNDNLRLQTQNQILELTKKTVDLGDQIFSAKNTYPQINLDDDLKDFEELKRLLFGGDYDLSKELYDKIITSLNTKIESEKAKGILVGKAAFDTKIITAETKVMQGETEVVKLQFAEDGAFTYWLPVGQYILKVIAVGYSEFSQDFEIKTGETKEISISLSKLLVKTTAPKPKPSKAAPTANVNDGVYSKESVATDRGTFSVHLLRIDPSQYEMKIDTAADDDCITDCPVKSLSSYVSQNGGFAGIHGTYFCPTSYSTCASQTNSFYYKLFNTRLGKRINWSNGLGDYLPFLSINSSGHASYFDTWDSAKNTDMKAGISCRPHLVENSQIVLTDGDMDSDKERYSKMSHGFIGLKGQTIYAGIVLSANLPDSAAVVQALGVENAFNIDGGGTSAMYYSGGYKVGPGRDMPNAIIFVKK